MTEQLISLETAKLAKEKGFDWPTAKAYDKCDMLCTYEPGKLLNYNTSGYIKSAPTQSQLQKWLRDKHESVIVIRKSGDSWHWYIQGIIEDGYEPTYEEALEAGLKECLELL